jgi:hypothetical protein
LALLGPTGVGLGLGLGPTGVGGGPGLGPTGVGVGPGTLGTGPALSSEKRPIELQYKIGVKITVKTSKTIIIGNHTLIFIIIHYKNNRFVIKNYLIIIF